MDIPRLLRLITACFLLSTCGPVTDGRGDFPEPAQGGWVLVEGGGPEGPVRGLLGERVTLTVEPRGLGGSVGCNSFGGQATVDGTRIILEGMGGTAMGCAEPLMAMEEAYATALMSVDRFELVGDQLVLTGTGTQLTFERRPEVDTVALYDTTWQLESIVEGDAVATVAGDPATLVLTEGGRLSGSTGCRTLTGEFVLASDTLQLTTFRADGGCPPGLSRQDGLVIEILGDGVVPTVDGEVLTMSDGAKALIYRAAS